MKRDLQGRFVTVSTVSEKVEAFLPSPLPPDPPIDWTPELRGKFDKALLALGRISGSVQVTHHAMMERPIASPVWLRDKTGLSLTTIGTSLERLEGLGIVKELTGQKRNRLYAYTQYISIMNQGTEL